ncbi:WXG100 family type VII secretion target [Actinomadura atramentaria]|uniref:WXG100 family type VII secretion target n=1 Tax=Actinomadura atramentaria TaxID=1990 RepID=UPI0003A99238|nr:WXG100 family type VII secretion target [Actinomadura atramentaria]
MGTFNAYDTFMGIATTGAGIASIDLPPAIPINIEFKLSKGNPNNLETASQSWDKTAKKLQQTAQELKQSLDAIPADAWTAQDREAYARKVQEFCQQLDTVSTYCEAVSKTLYAYAAALFIYAGFAMGMGTSLAALAVAFAAAAAGIITAVACPEIEAAAAVCLTITSVATGILAAGATIAAMVFQGGSLLAAVKESTQGNKQALTDFTQAQATGSAAALANLGQNAANAGLAVLNSRGGAGSPIQNVDLDADRNANHTWNVGGGVTADVGGNTVTGGGHVKIGDHGLAGGDLSGNFTSKTGLSGGGNVEYTDEDGIGQGQGGSVKYGVNGGYETPGKVGFNNPDRPPSATGGYNDGVPIPTGGVKVGITGQHDFGTGQGNVSGSVSGQVAGGDVGKQTETYNYGNPKTPTWTHQTDTPTGTTKKQDETPPWD